MIASTTTTHTSVPNRISAVRSDARMPSTASTIITAAGTMPINHHGTSMFASVRSVL